MAGRCAGLQAYKQTVCRLASLCPCRHEKVQENCIDLVGRIADRGAEFVPAREWMRICFELLDMLKVSCSDQLSSFGSDCHVQLRSICLELLDMLKVNWWLIKYSWWRMSIR